MTKKKTRCALVELEVDGSKVSVRIQAKGDVTLADVEALRELARAIAHREGVASVRERVSGQVDLEELAGKGGRK